MLNSTSILFMDAKFGDNMISAKPSHLKKKAIRLITFSSKDTHSSPLFKETSIIKLEDQIRINNMLFVHQTLRNESPNHFNDFIKLHLPNHGFNTRNILSSRYSMPPGSVSLANLQNKTIKFECAKTWNKHLKKIPNLPKSPIEILFFSPEKLKKGLKHMFNLDY